MKISFNFKTINPRLWLAVVGSSFIVILGAYTLVQQSTRLGADDTPLILAEATRHKLDNGLTPQQSLPPDRSILSQDSIPFVIITDQNQKLLASSAKLDGVMIVPPAGTFASTLINNSDDFTWQPRTGVRLATHMEYYQKPNRKFFIISGQSLREPEKRIKTYTMLAVLSFIGAIMWTSFVLSLNIKRP